MILSDTTIKSLIEKGDLVISPFKDDALQPASVDCSLGNHFLRVNDMESSILSLDKEIHYNEIEDDTIILQAHSFILATTEEYIEIPNGLTAFVEGRSYIGRMGLFIQNAGWVDAGFKGRITLELYNANNIPIELKAGRRICQLVFCKMDQDAQNPYQGKYLGQKRAVGSRVFQDQR